MQIDNKYAELITYIANHKTVQKEIVPNVVNVDILREDQYLRFKRAEEIMDEALKRVKRGKK